MKRLLTTLCALLFGHSASASEPDTDALYHHQLKRLHSAEVVDLRERFAGKPMLVINTASFCGFTGQFEGLEALHQRYKDQGLMVVGFPSDDFNQEAKNEEKSAEVCFVNFGVTFDMFSPIHVKGDNAHPIFREIARQSDTPPRWNFYKYVIDRDGKVTAAFSSMTSPDSRKLRKAIEAVL
ncbi:glutathione peroxidase [Marinobacterium iners]|jgi:glutathione peroxidase|uniref:glutathione peroxidase n=1 Tax=Marinobacterium iners TaxID=48076 RepID=UPI001A8E733B|nr:glutathione peroxidase [Marinobacterium iners]QSR36534.1 glutathione peroxidase [Marinobacterium iners]